MARRCSFKVKWMRNLHGGEDAVLFNSRGRSVNAINYAKGYKLTVNERRRAERVLLKPHCK